ncbi:MAG TPA: hypothetical protein VI007_11935 [bacterium]
MSSSIHGSARLPVALSLGFVLAVTGWILFSRQQDAVRTQEFAAQANRMRANTVDAVDFFKHIGARRRPPTPEELRAWYDRNAKVDADVTAVALRLRTASQRERALRWLKTQRALRSARVSARVITASRILFDYCTERQQFVGEALRGFAPSERMAALDQCFDQQIPASDAGLHGMRDVIARREADEAGAWAALLAVAPGIRR